MNAPKCYVAHNACIINTGSIMHDIFITDFAVCDLFDTVSTPCDNLVLLLLCVTVFTYC